MWVDCLVYGLQAAYGQGQVRGLELVAELLG